MDAELFAKMLTDKNLTDLKKLTYKYPQADIKEFVALLDKGFYKKTELKDFKGKKIVFLEKLINSHTSALKALLSPQAGKGKYGIKAMEEEVAYSLLIEQVDFSRESVRKIFSGRAPSDEGEEQIYAMKKGLDFIGDTKNTITEENIFKLYKLAIASCLSKDDSLLPGEKYRHDSVYVVGSELEHAGLPHSQLETYMKDLISFINDESTIDDLVKAVIIHYYLAYIHPYFDGNGRMARLLHLWYLVQKGYPSALFVTISQHIEKSRSAYYKAYSLIHKNALLSGFTDITAFLLYCNDNIYNKLSEDIPANKAVDTFHLELEEGRVTLKEKELWHFVLSAYGYEDFSTKQLEKDFANAAYATIRAFVLKFESMGLLDSKKYGNRVRYAVKD